jgi:hypothetical protein
VYGVGHSDNVILYEEHLRDDRNGDGEAGIEPGELVTEQAGIHPANINKWTASAMSAPIDGSAVHSNVHIGELHWETNDPTQSGNPTDPAITPNPSADFEVDYFESSKPEARAVLPRVEQNYALYGIDVSITEDQNLSRADLEQSFPFDDDDPPTSRDDAQEIRERFGDPGSVVYLHLHQRGIKLLQRVGLVR